MPIKLPRGRRKGGSALRSRPWAACPGPMRTPVRTRSVPQADRGGKTEHSRPEARELATSETPLPSTGRNPRQHKAELTGANRPAAGSRVVRDMEDREGQEDLAVAHRMGTVPLGLRDVDAWFACPRPQPTLLLRAPSPADRPGRDVGGLHRDRRRPGLRGPARMDEPTEARGG